MGVWTHFPLGVVCYPVCGVSRGTILSGRRQQHLDGFYTHGESDQTATVGTAAWWDNLVGGSVLYPRALQRRGYKCGCFGKYINRYPWGKGDYYIPDGWDQWCVFLDDEAQHPTHIGPAFFNYFLNRNGAIVNRGARDLWTTTGADATGRVVDTDYSTDFIFSELNTWVANAPQPFYAHTGVYAVKQQSSTVGPANRHLSAPTSGLPNRPAVAPSAFVISPASRGPSFNEPDLISGVPAFSAKAAWIRAAFPTAFPDPGTVVSDWDSEQRAKWRTHQAIDEGIRDLLAALTARGILDNTMIVVTTENSNADGEHRFDKKGMPYECCIRSPLYVHYPTTPARANLILIIVDDAKRDGWAKMPHLSSLPTVTNNSLVGMIDIAPSFLELAQAARSMPRSMDGQSFIPLLDGRMSSAQWRTVGLFEWVENNSVNALTPGFTGILDANRKLIRYAAKVAAPAFAAEDEFYDLAAGGIAGAADPDELFNKRAVPAYDAQRVAMGALLDVLRS